MPAESDEQVARARSLLALYGAPDHMDLWHALDYVVTKKNRRIIALEQQIQMMKGLGINGRKTGSVPNTARCA